LLKFHIGNGRLLCRRAAQHGYDQVPSNLKEANMAVFRDRPYSGMNFFVDLGFGEEGSSESGVFEVIFPEARVHVIEYRNGNETPNEPRKVQSFTHYGNLVIKRGAIGSLNWYSWWNEFRKGIQTDLRTIRVRLLDEDHTSVVLEWRFLRARPVNHQFSPLNALCSEILIETLEMAFEELEME
jgi:phage tail-like protein